VLIQKFLTGGFLFVINYDCSKDSNHLDQAMIVFIGVCF